MNHSHLPPSGIGQRRDSRDILNEVFRQTVPLSQVLRIIVREPDPSLAILRNEYLQWQVESDAWSGKHERRSCFGTAEYRQFGGGHFDSHFRGFTAVVDDNKEGDAFRLQKAFKFVDRLVDGVIAGNFHYAIHFVSLVVGRCGRLLAKTGASVSPAS
jgi:hypothetical protein